MNTYELMSREFSTAKIAWAAIVILQFVLLGCTMFAVSTKGGMLLFLGAVLLVIPIASLMLRWRADIYYDRGEQLRRAYVLENALGKKMESAAALAAQATAAILPSIDPKPVGGYYASALPQGLRRLTQNMAESAFYSWRIAAITSYWCATLTITGLGIAIFILWWAVQTGHPAQAAQPGLEESGERVAKLFSDVFGFVAAGVFAELWRLYAALSKTAERVYPASLRISGEESPDQLAVFTVMSEYDTALAKTPPLPGLVKWCCSSRLAKAWADQLDRARA